MNGVARAVRNPRFGSGRHQRLARDGRSPTGPGRPHSNLTSCYRRTVRMIIDHRSESSRNSRPAILVASFRDAQHRGTGPADHIITHEHVGGFGGGSGERARVTGQC
jgi:hypothetical protein